jgi:8-oxo-dGTP pyrophosphatase MutT (NUDIX family)
MTAEATGDSGFEMPGNALDPEMPYARLAVVGLIARPAEASDAEEWLLLRRVGPLEIWDPPGGRVERGEGLHGAVLREVEEETGLSVLVAGPCYAYLTFHKGERLIAVSMACRVRGEFYPVRLEPENAVDWRWVTAEEWGRLAAEAKSSWEPLDVARGTRLAVTIWETGER